MCTSPNYSLYIPGKDKEPGWIKFIPKRVDQNYRQLKEKYGDALITLPCGKCEECIRDYATTWAVRCAIEAEQWEHNWFITLTYNNAFIPKNGKCSKKDINDFIDKLAGGHKLKTFKYWIAGEIGPLTHRPHYHGILFNFPLPDLKIIGKKENGFTIYESETLNKAWGKGFIQIGTAEDDAAAYCAKYAAKGGTENFKPMMSKGIGLKYILEHQEFINTYGYIPGKKGKKYKIPRYYFKKIITEEAQKLKERQKAKARAKTAEHARFDHLEIHLEKQAEYEARQKGGRTKT